MGERVEGIFSVVLLYVRVVADPFIAQGRALFAAGEHPAHQLAGERGVRIVCAAVGDKGVKLCAHFVRVLENAGRTAVDGTVEIFAVLGRIVARDHRAHGMPEQEIGQIRVLFAHEVVEALFVLHHGVRAAVAPVSPGVVGDGRCPVPYVVVCGHDVACVHERYDEMEIAAGVLAETMDELYDALRFASGNVNPAGDGVTFVGRRELDFMKHGSSFRSGWRVPRRAPKANTPWGHYRARPVLPDGKDAFNAQDDDGRIHARKIARNVFVLFGGFAVLPHERHVQARTCVARCFFCCTRGCNVVDQARFARALEICARVVVREHKDDVLVIRHCGGKDSCVGRAVRIHGGNDAQSFEPRHGRA